VKSLRTRIAPTPSGSLHPGNGLSFIMTWAIARAAGGKIMLRIDDLDKERYRPAYVEDIFRTLEWLGIDYDEGPDSVDDFEQNWSQHLRIEHYNSLLTQLQKKGLLFACNCSRKQIREQSDDGRYPNTCQHKQLAFAAKNTAWRITPPQPAEQVVINDWKEGLQTVRLSNIDAFVVRQKNGLPAYQLASLLDDETYNINFIVRGQDLWESTLSQLYLAQLLDKNDFLNTRFFHHPLILDEKGLKLSKSKGAGSLKAWREAGKSNASLFAMAGQQLGLKEEVVNGQSLLAYLGKTEL
jgi:glutamyl-tRNA synthetase